MNVDRSRATAVVGALVAAGALALLAGAPFARRAAERLSIDEAPAPVERRNRLLAALREGDLLHPRPPRPLGTTPSDATTPCREPTVGTRPIVAGSEPSAPGLDQLAATAPQATVLSVWVDPCRLERLHESPESAAGRRREELGWVSFRSPEGSDWHSAVGLRLHSGPDERGRWRRGYRLHFRPRYRADGFPGERLDPALAGQRLDRLIVRKDALSDHRGVRWSFLQPTAFEITRRLGGLAPATRPVAFVLNGRLVDVFALTEPVNRDLLSRRFGHRRFDLVRAKPPREPAEQARWTSERGWLDQQPRPLDPARVRGRYDLDELTRWLVTDLFCATGDSFQAWLARDRDREVHGGLWFPIDWDMDVSFLRFLNNPTWRRMQDPLSDLLLPDRARTEELLIRQLARRLLAESPAYRQELGRAVAAALNHDLTPAFLDRLHARLVADAERLGIERREFLDGYARFFARRPDELLAQLDERLGLGPAVAVRVDGPPGRLRVDGRSVELPWTGRYPARLPMTVEVEPAARERFLGWTVDGVDRPGGTGPNLELPAGEARAIRARFHAEAAAAPRIAAGGR